MAFECFDEYRRCELGALIRIEDFRFAMPVYGIRHYLPAQFCTHRIGNVPPHDLAAIDIDDAKHVHESAGHRNVGDIRLPDLIAPFYLKVPEQIRNL